MISRIRQEAFRDSKVMDIAETLTDRYGFRLTGSPGLDDAEEWARQELESFGLKNAHLEPWGPFGRGWQNDFVSVRMIEPVDAPLYAIPLAWTRGTGEPLSAEVMRVEIKEEKDFDQYRGKLAGKILLMGETPELKPTDRGNLRRYDQKELDELALYEIPGERGNAWVTRWAKRREFREKLAAFLSEEGAAAVIDPGSGNGDGTFHVQSGGAYKPDGSLGVPTVAMAPEHWGRIARLLAHDEKVSLELDIRNRILEDRKGENNVIAEIPGSDPKAGVVMLGGHIDAWHAGTGATDNAAGVAVVMEAARILNELGVRPKRTIRVALWSGEEQGLLGSRAWVEQHLASWPEPEDAAQKDLPPWWRKNEAKPTWKPEQKTLDAYFNLDNGTGKIRGIYTQENLAVVPIFHAWLEPLRDLGATTISTNNTGGTDHLGFDAAGVPAFQFIQDEVEYETLTHHSNWDVYERLQREDLMQAAAVMATFVWEAANRPDMLPRKPLD